MLSISIKDTVLSLLALTGLAVARPAPEPDLLIPEHRGYWPLRRKDRPTDEDIDAAADDYVTALHGVVGDSFRDSAPRAGRHRKPRSREHQLDLVPPDEPEPADRMWYEDLPSAGKTLVVNCAPPEAEPAWEPAAYPEWTQFDERLIGPERAYTPGIAVREPETLSQLMFQREAEVAEQEDQAAPGMATTPDTPDPTLVRMTRAAIDAHIRPYLDQLPTYED